MSRPGKKRTTTEVDRLESIRTFLESQAEDLAKGDGSSRMWAMAITLWDRWPIHMGVMRARAIDAFGEDEQAGEWIGRLRIALWRTLNAAVRLMAREAEREGIDTTDLWRGWHCLGQLLGDSSIERFCPTTDDQRRQLPGDTYQLWRDADAVVARLRTKLEIRPDKSMDELTQLSVGWRKLSDVAERLGMRRQEVFRLLENGELSDNGKKGHSRRVNPASILDYCDRKGMTYGAE
jgi:hypothetical protein